MQRSWRRQNLLERILAWTVDTAQVVELLLSKCEVLGLTAKKKNKLIVREWKCWDAMIELPDCLQYIVTQGFLGII
jgi:hypothetical protein